MYETHFGLRTQPFRGFLDSECYYPATGHEQALDRLMSALTDQHGYGLLTGEPGTGKTLLCHRLLKKFGAKRMSVLLANSHVHDRSGLFQCILYDLSQPYEGRSEQELRLALTENLLQNFAMGGATLIVADDAHHLKADLLEELRLLGNIEACKGRGVQVLLIGQAGIEETLKSPELAALNQRLVERVKLEPLDKEEAVDFLAHRVRAAGGRPDELFTQEALELLASGTKGIPRLLHQAAHHAFSLAHNAEASVVDAEAALEALNLLGLQAGESEEEPESYSFGPVQELGSKEEEESPDPTSVLLMDQPPNYDAEGEDDGNDDEDHPHRFFPTPRRPA